jgi:hypothetical protein
MNGQTEKQGISRSDQLITNGLSERVISELDLLLALNISRSILDTLRLTKGFPTVRLSLQSRVYLIDSVAEWLRRQETRQG